MKNAEMILDQIDVVKLDINLWTSSKKLRAEDLLLAVGSKLPPEDLASLGVKKTIDPDKLKEFNRIKKEAERICLQSGTRFIGGFANPRTEIPRITQELDALSRKFYEERDQFLASYTADTEEWISRHAEFGDAIRRAIEPAESVASKLRFDYVVFRVTKSDSAQQDNSLDRRTHSMSEQLFREIAQEASQVIDRSFVGKDSVTGRVLNAFRRIRDKLDSLGFLDHRCMPVVDKIDQVLGALPKQGPYNGIAFNSLFTLGLLLSDPDKIKRHGSGLLMLDSLVTDPEETDDVADDQIVPATDSNIVDIKETQQPEPEIVVIAEDNEMGQQPEAESESDIDDLPGFDDFLSKYDASKEESVGQVAVQATPESSVRTDAVSGFMEDILETVKTAATQTSASVPVESVKDELDDHADDESESEDQSATATDFWF
jgi:hypothetical protein